MKQLTKKQRRFLQYILDERPKLLYESYYNLIRQVLIQDEYTEDINGLAYDQTNLNSLSEDKLIRDSYKEYIKNKKLINLVIKNTKSF
jgi:hypothetical protein